VIVSPSPNIGGDDARAHHHSAGSMFEILYTGMSKHLQFPVCTEVDFFLAALLFKVPRLLPSETIPFGYSWKFSITFLSNGSIFLSVSFVIFVMHTAKYIDLQYLVLSIG